VGNSMRCVQQHAALELCRCVTDETVRVSVVTVGYVLVGCGEPWQDPDLWTLCNSDVFMVVGIAPL
jgi:hypothetical protein